MIISHWRKLITLFFATVAMYAANGQQKVEMADKMRDNGRIYVVVAVVLTILAGLIIYLVRLDRKITHLEKNN